MHSKEKTQGNLLLVLVALLGVYCCASFGYEWYQQSQVQTVFDVAIHQAEINFRTKRANDTLDFTRLAPGAWDTVYVFEGYTSRQQVAEEVPRISWGRGFGGMVPENTNRYVFIRGRVAQYYVDIQGTASTPHFRRYVQDEFGGSHTQHTDRWGRVHKYTVNHFARAEAQFIIVCGIDLPQGDTTAYMYVPLRFFQQHLSHDAPSNLQYLHPLRGCGYPNCLANAKETTQIGQ
jgi:hypothetical protein